MHDRSLLIATKKAIGIIGDWGKIRNFLTGRAGNAISEMNESE